jgi:hypothetical protein
MRHEVTPGIFSEFTGRHYDTIEDLVSEETNGWVATAVVDHGKKIGVGVWGPFDSRKDARNALLRLKTVWRREGIGRPGQTVRTKITWLAKPEETRA